MRGSALIEEDIKLVAVEINYQFTGQGVRCNEVKDDLVGILQTLPALSNLSKEDSELQELADVLIFYRFLVRRTACEKASLCDLYRKPENKAVLTAIMKLYFPAVEDAQVNTLVAAFADKHHEYSKAVGFSASIASALASASASDGDGEPTVAAATTSASEPVASTTAAGASASVPVAQPSAAGESKQEVDISYEFEVEGVTCKEVKDDLLVLLDDALVPLKGATNYEAKLQALADTLIFYRCLVRGTPCKQSSVCDFYRQDKNKAVLTAIMRRYFPEVTEDSQVNTLVAAFANKHGQYSNEAAARASIASAAASAHSSAPVVPSPSASAPAHSSATADASTPQAAPAAASAPAPGSSSRASQPATGGGDGDRSDLGATTPQAAAQPPSDGDGESTVEAATAAGIHVSAEDVAATKRESTRLKVKKLTEHTEAAKVYIAKAELLNTAALKEKISELKEKISELETKKAGLQELTSGDSRDDDEAQAREIADLEKEIAALEKEIEYLRQQTDPVVAEIDRLVEQAAKEYEQYYRASDTEKDKDTKTLKSIVPDGKSAWEKRAAASEQSQASTSSFLGSERKALVWQAKQLALLAIATSTASTALTANVPGDGDCFLHSLYKIAGGRDGKMPFDRVTNIRTMASASILQAVNGAYEAYKAACPGAEANFDNFLAHLAGNDDVKLKTNSVLDRCVYTILATLQRGELDSAAPDMLLSKIGAEIDNELLGRNQDMRRRLTLLKSEDTRLDGDAYPHINAAEAYGRFLLEAFNETIQKDSSEKTKDSSGKKLSQVRLIRDDFKTNGVQLLKPFTPPEEQGLETGYLHFDYTHSHYKPLVSSKDGSNNVAEEVAVFLSKSFCTQIGSIGVLEVELLKETSQQKSATKTELSKAVKNLTGLLTSAFNEGKGGSASEEAQKLYRPLFKAAADFYCSRPEYKELDPLSEFADYKQSTKAIYELIEDNEGLLKDEIEVVKSEMAAEAAQKAAKAAADAAAAAAKAVAAADGAGSDAAGDASDGDGDGADDKTKHAVESEIQAGTVVESDDGAGLGAGLGAAGSEVVRQTATAFVAVAVAKGAAAGAGSDAAGSLPADTAVAGGAVAQLQTPGDSLGAGKTPDEVAADGASLGAGADGPPPAAAAGGTVGGAGNASAGNDAVASDGEVVKEVEDSEQGREGVGTPTAAAVAVAKAAAGGTADGADDGNSEQNQGEADGEVRIAAAQSQIQPEGGGTDGSEGDGTGHESEQGANEAASESDEVVDAADGTGHESEQNEVDAAADHDDDDDDAAASAAAAAALLAADDGAGNTATAMVVALAAETMLEVWTVQLSATFEINKLVEMYKSMRRAVGDSPDESGSTKRLLPINECLFKIIMHEKFNAAKLVKAQEQVPSDADADASADAVNGGGDIENAEITREHLDDLVSYVAGLSTSASEVDSQSSKAHAAKEEVDYHELFIERLISLHKEVVAAELAAAPAPAAAATSAASSEPTSQQEMLGYAFMQAIEKENTQLMLALITHEEVDIIGLLSNLSKDEIKSVTSNKDTSTAIKERIKRQIQNKLLQFTESDSPHGFAALLSFVKKLGPALDSLKEVIGGEVVNHIKAQLTEKLTEQMQPLVSKVCTDRGDAEALRELCNKCKRNFEKETRGGILHSSAGNLEISSQLIAKAQTGLARSWVLGVPGFAKMISFMLQNFKFARNHADKYLKIKPFLSQSMGEEATDTECKLVYKLIAHFLPSQELRKAAHGARKSVDSLGDGDLPKIIEFVFMSDEFRTAAAAAANAAVVDGAAGSAGAAANAVVGPTAGAATRAAAAAAAAAAVDAGGDAATGNGANRPVAGAALVAAAGAGLDAAGSPSAANGTGKGDSADKTQNAGAAKPMADLPSDEWSKWWKDQLDGQHSILELLTTYQHIADEASEKGYSKSVLRDLSPFSNECLFKLIMHDTWHIITKDGYNPADLAKSLMQMHASKDTGNGSSDIGNAKIVRGQLDDLIVYVAGLSKSDSEVDSESSDSHTAGEKVDYNKFIARLIPLQNAVVAAELAAAPAPAAAATSAASSKQASTQEMLGYAFLQASESNNYKMMLALLYNDEFKIEDFYSRCPEPVMRGILDRLISACNSASNSTAAAADVLNRLATGPVGADAVVGAAPGANEVVGAAAAVAAAAAAAVAAAAEAKAKTAAAAAAVAAEAKAGAAGAVVGAGAQAGNGAGNGANAAPPRPLVAAVDAAKTPDADAGLGAGADAAKAVVAPAADSEHDDEEEKDTVDGDVDANAGNGATGRAAVVATTATNAGPDATPPQRRPSVRYMAAMYESEHGAGEAQVKATSNGAGAAKTAGANGANANTADGEPAADGAGETTKKSSVRDMAALINNIGSGSLPSPELERRHSTQLKEAPVFAGATAAKPPRPRVVSAVVAGATPGAGTSEGKRNGNGNGAAPPRPPLVAGQRNGTRQRPKRRSMRRIKKDAATGNGANGTAPPRLRTTLVPAAATAGAGAPAAAGTGTGTGATGDASTHASIHEVAATGDGTSAGQRDGNFRDKQDERKIGRLTRKLEEAQKLPPTNLLREHLVLQAKKSLAEEIASIEGKRTEGPNNGGATNMSAGL